MRRVRTVCTLVALLLMPAVAGAQLLADIWDISASFGIQAGTCNYTGTGTFTDAGGPVSGPISLTLDPNQPQGCPGDLTGVLQAVVQGTGFNGTVDGANDPNNPNLGLADVMGTIAGSSFMGTSTTRTGQFIGSTGDISGQLRQPMPTLGPAALAALVALLLGGSSLLLVRRRA